MPYVSQPALSLPLALLLAAAPLAAKDHGAPLKPGKYEDWNGNIDRMEIVKTFSLADYQRVRVEPLDTKDTPLPPAGDKRRAYVVNVLGRATNLFVEGMRDKFKPARATPIEIGAMPAPAAAPAAVNDSAAAPAPAAAAPTASAPAATSAPADGPAPASAPAAAPAGRTLLIRARVTEMNPGSKAARFWASFGAGHTDTEISGEVLDADSGEVLVRFTTGRGSSGTMSLAGGNYEKMMSGDTADDGKNVGEMLSLFK